MQHGQIPAKLQYVNNDGRPKKLPRVAKTYAGRGGDLSFNLTGPNELAGNAKPTKRLRK